MHAIFPLAWQVSPELVRGDREERCEQPRQSVGDRVDHGLRRPPLGRAGAQRVETVLRDIDIKRAQIDGQKIVQCVRDRLKFVSVVCSKDLLRRLTVAGEYVSVDFLQASVCDEINRRVEVVEVRGQDPKRVADLAVGLDHPGEDLLADPESLHGNRPWRPTDAGPRHHSA